MASGQRGCVGSLIWTEVENKCGLENKEGGSVGVGSVWTTRRAAPFDPGQLKGREEIALWARRVVLLGVGSMWRAGEEVRSGQQGGRFCWSRISVERWRRVSSLHGEQGVRGGPLALLAGTWGGGGSSSSCGRRY